MDFTLQGNSSDSSKLNICRKIYQKHALDYILEACEDIDQVTTCLQKTGQAIRNFETALTEFVDCNRPPLTLTPTKFF